MLVLSIGDPVVDICIYGDYELAFTELMTKGIKEGSGVISRNSDGSIRKNPKPYAEELDELPLPDRSGINQTLYTGRGTMNPQATIHVSLDALSPAPTVLHTQSLAIGRAIDPLKVLWLK